MAVMTPSNSMVYDETQKQATNHTEDDVELEPINIAQTVNIKYLVLQYLETIST